LQFRHPATLLVHKCVATHLTIPASSVLTFKYENEMNRSRSPLPTRRAKGGLVVALIVERLFELHLFSQLESFLKIFDLGVEIAILLNKVHDASVQIEDSGIQFNILDLMDRIGDFLRVVEDPHANNCRIRRLCKTGGESHVLVAYLSPAFR
jgi:hypothetical protein